MSENEKTILKLLRDKGGAKYTDIEPLMKLGSHDKFWTTFSTICSLISAGVIVSGFIVLANKKFNKVNKFQIGFN